MKYQVSFSWNREPTTLHYTKLHYTPLDYTPLHSTTLQQQLELQLQLPYGDYI